MNRVADNNGMIARRATPVVVILRCQGAQHSERPFLSQPARTLALRAVCGVRLLANGMTIRVVTFLASHPAKRECAAMRDLIRGSLTGIQLTEANTVIDLSGTGNYCFRTCPTKTTIAKPRCSSLLYQLDMFTPLLKPTRSPTLRSSIFWPAIQTS